MLQFIDTPFSDLKLIAPTVHGDSRGYFMEAWKKSSFVEAGIAADFVQDNESSSSYGVVRGLHWQAAPYAQTKLLRVVIGKILDVVVDLRRSEPTYGKHYSVILSEEDHRQFYVPKGFAHGFAVLSEKAIVQYKVDVPWVKEAERCLRFDDAELAIEWPIPEAARILSAKDLQGMSWQECREAKEGF